MILNEIDASNLANNQLIQLMAIILSGIFGWGASMINGRQERKKIKLEAAENNKKISERDALLMDQMRGFDNKLVDLSMGFLEFKENNEFKSRLMNSMRSIATNLIDYNVDLDAKYKHLIMQMAREFEDFAMRFYYSDMRGITHAITPYLRIDMESRISKFETYAEHINSKPKIFKYTAGKEEEIIFLDYLKKTNLYSKIELLLFVLEKNGLSPDKVIEEFGKFISDFFKVFIHVVNEWENIGK